MDGENNIGSPYIKEDLEAEGIISQSSFCGLFEGTHLLEATNPLT